jgi:hypothetical protein
MNLLCLMTDLVVQEEPRIFKSVLTEADKRAMVALTRRLDAFIERGEPANFAELRSIQQELELITDKYVDCLRRM